MLIFISFAALNPMPGTECIWLESYNDKGLNLDQLFGFFYAEVVTNNQYFGLLPLQTKEGLSSALRAVNFLVFGLQLNYNLLKNTDIK